MPVSRLVITRSRVWPAMCVGSLTCWTYPAAPVAWRGYRYTDQHERWNHHKWWLDSCRPTDAQMLLITHQKTAMIELDCQVGRRQMQYELTTLGRRIVVQVLERWDADVELSLLKNNGVAVDNCQAAVILKVNVVYCCISWNYPHRHDILVARRRGSLQRGRFTSLVPRLYDDQQVKRFLSTGLCPTSK